MGSSVIEAVGGGEVTAYMNEPDLPGCAVTLTLNGEAKNTIYVEDGDQINVDLTTEGSCSCCRTHSECSSSTAGLWVHKSNKDRSTISLNKRELLNKIRTAAKKVRGRRP